MLRQIKAGSTSVTLPVFLQDSSSTTGAGLSGLVHNSSNLTCYYKRSDGTAEVAVTLADVATLGTYAAGGFKQWGATNSKGMYEFHPPDAALAAGAKWVVFFFRGATNLADTPVLVELTGTDNQDATAGGITRLDAAVSGVPAAWGASVIGNGRTRDYFLQGGCNKVAFAADGLTFTVYSTDDTTPLYTGVSTRLATTVGGLRSVDPA